MAVAALLMPPKAAFDAIGAYADKIAAETISDAPLKATLIYEAMQRWGITPEVMAQLRGQTVEAVNAYLAQRINPALTVDFYGAPYREIDRAKVERQIRSVQAATGIRFFGGMSNDWYIRDMAQKLATRGVSDLTQFQSVRDEITVPAGTPAEYAGSDETPDFPPGYYIRAASPGGPQWLYPVAVDQLKTGTYTYEADSGYATIERLVTAQPVKLDRGVAYYVNKTNGARFAPGPWDSWESAFEGKGGVYYLVKFTPSGLPVFYTQWMDTGNFKAIMFLASAAVAAFGLPNVIGQNILGALNITASPAVTTAVGNVALNTALTGGDVVGSVASAASGLAGSAFGGQIATQTDSIILGKAAEVVAKAAITGKNVDPLKLAQAMLSPSTAGITMGDEDTSAMGYDSEAFGPSNYEFSQGDYTFDPTTIGYDSAAFGDITAADLNLDQTSLADILAQSDFEIDYGAVFGTNIDDLGNVYDEAGQLLALSPAAYFESFYADTEGIKDGYNNVVVSADKVATMTQEQVTQEIANYASEKSGEQVTTAPRSPLTPERNPAVAPTAIMPDLRTVADTATVWDKIFRSAVAIGASVKAITDGTFRATYPVSQVGTPRAPIGMPVQRADGAMVTNNADGSQTIQYPDGRVQRVSSTYWGASGGLIPGVSNQTLLIGGAVLLGAVLLLRRK